MSQRSFAWFIQALASLCLLTLGAPCGLGQTTAFTYQGKLTDAGNPANGAHDLQFRLFDALVSANQIGSTIVREDVAVSGGIFTVTLDFGAAAFPGANRFLEIGVRPGASTGLFTTLAPLQPITTTPYAIQSLNAATAANFSGALAGDVIGTQTATTLASNAVTTSKLADGSVTDAKIVAVAGSKVTGTILVASVPAGSGNYIQNGTALQASSNFNLSGNGTLGGILTANALFSSTLRQELTTPAPNVINGFLGTGSAGATPGNRVTAGVVGATIGGGGFNAAITFPSGLFISGDLSNRVTDWFGAVGGGFGNRAGDEIGALDSAFYATVGGGRSNTASGEGATVGGGLGNTASGGFATVGGGLGNTASGERSFAAGSQAKAQHLGSFVWADASSGAFTSSTDHQFLIRATGGVGIGTNAPQHALTVLGGPLWTQSQWSGSLELGNKSALGWRGNAGGWHFGIGQDNAGFHIFQTASPPGTSPTTSIFDLTITDAGRVGINTSTPDRQLSVNGGANKIGGGSWEVFSDERLKNVKGLYQRGLQAVLQLQPIRYEYKPDNALGLASLGEHLGFSAQAVQQVIPEAISQNAQGYLLVDNDPILWTMLNAIKEQQAQLETQQKHIKQQQQQTEGLKKLLCKLQPQAEICQ